MYKIMIKGDKGYNFAYDTKKVTEPGVDENGKPIFIDTGKTKREIFATEKKEDLKKKILSLMETYSYSSLLVVDDLTETINVDIDIQ